MENKMDYKRELLKDFLEWFDGEELSKLKDHNEIISEYLVEKGDLEADVCEWKHNKDTFELYNTSCGKPLITEIGNFIYCPYCGKKIISKSA